MDLGYHTPVEARAGAIPRTARAPRIANPICGLGAGPRITDRYDPMGFLRFLILAGVIWLVIRVLASRGRRPRAPVTRRTLIGGSMVRCAHCGTHVPAAEALVDAGSNYCCDAHRRAHLSADSKRS